MQVKKRAIFYIGGYDPKSSDEFFDRLHRETSRFEQLWDVQVESGDRTKHGADVTIEKLRANGNDWAVETDFHFLTLDDIVLKDFQQPFWKRLGRSLITTIDYVLTGTAFKFLFHAWRFFLYFAYPPVAVVSTIVLAYFLASFISSLDVPYSGILALFSFGLVFAAMVQFFWKRRFVLHLMDLWSFSRDFVYRRRTDIEDKLDAFAGLATKRANEGTYDEILFVGHSTGGALILDTAARSVEKDPNLASRAKVSVLTVGSTSLKIGLHPAATWFRDRLKVLFSDPSMSWVEYQCHTDVINFYKTNPAKLMKLDIGDDRPIVQNIRIKAMLEPETYKRIRSNFFRVHYQFVFGNTRKYHYDFPAICFAPMALRDRALQPDRAATSLLPKY